MSHRSSIWLLLPFFTLAIPGCASPDGEMSSLAEASAASAASETPALGQDDSPAEAALDAAAPSSEAPAPGPLAIQSIAPARPVVTTDDQRHLVYELLVQNPGPAGVSITGIDVIDPVRRRTIARLRGDALGRVLTIAPAGAPGEIAPGGLAIAFLDLGFERHQRLPRRLGHRFQLASDQQAGPTVVVIDEPGPSLGPPLSGDRLLDVNGCCDGAHRRALLPIDGGLFLAQRFAIDFVRIDDQSTFSGDPADNASYFIYGEDVLAVAGGEIVAIRDDMADNIPTQPLPPPSVETAAGNHIVQAFDDGRFALYAHLRPGSLRVRPGDRVQRGQPIAVVGNTGNSTEPHLHFHVMDRASPLASDGLPYTFRRFELQATIDFGAPEPQIIPIDPPQHHRGRLPRNGDVIGLP